MSESSPLSPGSLLAQGMHYLESGTGAVVPSIQPSTTFARDAAYELMGPYLYGRYEGPTTEATEHLLAALEGARAARLFASGMSAATAVLETVSSGQHVVAPAMMYHGIKDWLHHISKTRNVSVSFFDAPTTDAIAAAVKPGATTLVWIESMLNPTCDVIDIAAAADVAHRAGAALVVDATFTPPVTLRALDLGADIVLHSATKYLNGHSDVIAGVLATNLMDDRWDAIQRVRKLVGGHPGAFESWLLFRGLRTLALRYERASRNALAIAEHFERHPRLEAVLYPGLPSHPGHRIAAKQMRGGFGGMMALLVRGGARETRRVAERVTVFVRATSLGGVESLIEHRAAVEGPDSPVAPNLLRLSIGIEEVHDLIRDLEQALATDTGA